MLRTASCATRCVAPAAVVLGGLGQQFTAWAGWARPDSRASTPTGSPATTTSPAAEALLSLFAGLGADIPSAPRHAPGLTVNVWTDKKLLADFDDMRRFLHEIAAAGYSYAELGARGPGVIIGGKVQRSRLAALRDASRPADLPNLR
jgi:hypothetical protein